MVRELLQFLCVGVDFWIFELEIWIVFKFGLDDHLVDLLPIVLFREGLFDISVSLFLLFFENYILDQLEMDIDDCLNILDTFEEELVISFNIFFDYSAHVAKLQEVDTNWMRSFGFGIKHMLFVLLIDLEIGLEVLILALRSLVE